MRSILKVMMVVLLMAVMITAMACTGTPDGQETNAPTDAATTAGTEAATEEPTEAITDPETDASTEATTTAAPETEAPETEPGPVVKAERETLDFEATVTVSTSGNTATVTHKDGLTYTATGYTSAEGNKLTFQKGLTLTFDPAATSVAFNRFVMGYTSTQPLYGKITYTSEGKTVTDDFYLEAGTDTFACVIGQYLAGKTGTGIATMTFETCNDTTADFALCVLNTMEHPVYGTDGDTYCLENDRYKLGIRLSWGGGINYIEDKTSGINRLKNLVNQADTGRLIQQSYYGVQENAEYKPGYYNGSKWAYNPVQGGDVKQNHSRIIDIVVSNGSVYVKSQPQDWSKDNEITPSYMENAYTLYEDHIQVDNRFVDFSGWTHRYAHQELPAFYTVSYLSRFTLYNGTKPWTGDTLSYRDDLGFWGDSTYYNDCTFLIKNSNTETWCAWTNPGDDFGIGLYVPNVDSLLAGRHAFNNSKESKNSACNYVAPVNTMMLTSFEALEYSYLIATGSVEEIRSTFTEYKDFATNESLHENYQSRRIADSAKPQNEHSYADMDKENGGQASAPALSADLDLTVKGNVAHLISSSATTITYKDETAGTALTVTGGDPHVTINYQGELSANQYKTLEITYMLPTTNSDGNLVADLFLCAGSITNPDPAACIRESLIADGEYHTLIIDLSGKSFWKGDINKIRFDYLDNCAAGDVMYVKSIVLK